MQYDTIILELLSRIKALEEDVAQIKRALENLPAVDAAEPEEFETDAGSSGKIYTKLTYEMIEMCYQCGKKVHSGKSANDFADEIVAATGMNRNSAIMYQYVADCMLSGVVYKRAVSTTATRVYFDLIFADYGREGLERAIAATRLHIAYRRRLGQNVESIEKLCDEYEGRGA